MLNIKSVSLCLLCIVMTAQVIEEGAWTRRRAHIWHM